MIQLQVLNKILATRDASFLLLNNLTDDFFSDYKEEYKYIKSHLDSYGNVPDIETFLSKFPDFDVVDVKEGYDYLVDELYADKNRRELATVFNQIRELLNADKVSDAMQLYVSSKDRIASATHLNAVDISLDLSRYNQYVEKCEDYKKYYLTTGFRELDEIIGGWDRNEELATIVARPGVGKSWILLKCAIAAAQSGLTVGIYSGEMSENKVGYRADTLISHISNGKLIHGDISIQKEYQEYLKTIKGKIKGSIKVLTPYMIDGPAGVTALRAFVEKEKLDMLCIDQHSLLEDDRKARSPVEKAANISRDLKNLQVLKKIPIIAVSQQNRVSTTDTGVGTEHVAQSDRISQDSTIVLFLEQKDSVLTMTLVKSRDSVNGKKLNYAVDFNRGIFNYIPTEDDATDGKHCEEVYNEFEMSEDGENPF